MEVTSDPAQLGAANWAFSQSAYVGFDFTDGNKSAGWFSINGQTARSVQWEYSTNIASAHQLQLMAMDLGASYRLTSNIDFSSGLAAGGKYPGMWSPDGFLADRRFLQPVRWKLRRPRPCDLKPDDQPAVD
jgi:hypothetical protein